MSNRPAWFPITIQCMMIVQLSMINSHSKSADRYQPTQLVVKYTETQFSNKMVANLSDLLKNMDDHVPGGTAQLSMFELLDVSANLLTHHQSTMTQLHHFVTVETQMGLVQFQVPIDRERICPDVSGTNHVCTINLLLLAHKQAQHLADLDLKMVYIDLAVVVLDTNDNAPYFPELSSNYHAAGQTIWIEEELPIGSLISLPEAKDADSLENGIRHYQFHSTGTSLEIRQHFQLVLLEDTRLSCERITIATLQYNKPSVKNSSTIKPCLQVISRIDREKFERFTFRLLALDSGDRHCELNVQVMIKDINDHPPEWSKTLTYFDSNGQPKIIQARTFALDKQSNQTKTEYTFTVRECMKQRKLLQLQVKDDDDAETINGRFTIEFSKKTPNFNEISERFSISNDHYLYLTDLGLRDLGSYNWSLAIVATDGGGAESLVWVQLQVEDCNNYRPMIILKNNQFTIRERESTVPALIGLITVRDLDLVQSHNSKFECELNETTLVNLVKVVDGPRETIVKSNPMTYEVPGESFEQSTRANRRGRWSVYRLETKSGAMFDREILPVYHVQLQCVDNGLPVLTSTRIITIGIEDVNDNVPKFIRTNSQKHGLRFDSTSRWSENAQFRMNNDVLDKYEQSWFEYQVAEDTERGSMITQLQAMDLDIGENGRLKFELVANNETKSTDIIHKMFSVSTNGQLFLVGELDREEMDRFQLIVQVEDHGKPNSLSSTATIVVNVQDVNDCHPVFQREYAFKVVESYGSSMIHQILGTLNATDADSGRNGTVTYRLATKQDYLWSETVMHPTKSSSQYTSQVIKVTHDGQVTVYGIVDREKTPVIIVDVVAEDEGEPNRLSTMSTITIHVLDLNDNKPQFRVQRENISPALSPYNHSFGGLPPDTVQTLNISLDASIGTILTKFEAIDPDDGPNGTVIYSLIHSLGDGQYLKSLNSSKLAASPTFTLHPDGRLVLSSHLDSQQIYTPSAKNHSMINRYRRPDRLLVKATDNGPTPQYSIFTLHIYYFDSTRSNSSRSFLTRKTNQTGERNDVFRERSMNEINRYRTVPTGLFQRSGNPITEKSSRSHTQSMSILYLLVLAICFALILIVTSLLYLYIRMRRPVRTSGPGKSNRDMNATFDGRYNQPESKNHRFDDLRLTSNYDTRTIRQHQQSTEGDSTLPCPTTGSSSGMDSMDRSKFYRTVSPSVIYVNNDGCLQPGFDTECPNSPLFSTLTSAYSELSPTVLLPTNQKNNSRLIGREHATDNFPCMTVAEKISTEHGSVKQQQQPVLCSRSLSSDQCTYSRGYNDKYVMSKSMDNHKTDCWESDKLNNSVGNRTTTICHTAPGLLLNSRAFKQNHATGSFV